MSNLPAGWAHVSVHTVIRVQYGKGLTRRNRDGAGSIPVYGSAGIVGTHSSALVDGPALVIGRKGNVGSTYLSSGPCWPIDTTYFARIPPGLSPKYLAYQLQSMSLSELDSSTAIPSLRRESLETELLAIAPTTEQERIVAAVEEQCSRLDVGVAALERVIGPLTSVQAGRVGQLRSSILATAFSGKLVPQDPSDEPASGLLERIAAERASPNGRKLAKATRRRGKKAIA